MDEESKITLTATNKREWPNSTLKSLNTFRQTEHTLCDVFLRGEDTLEPIPAQRCVLAANSVYFHAMFTSGLAESKQDHREVSIRGVDTGTLSLIVEFLYVGSCRLPSGTMHRVMDLLAASTMLQVDELSHACSIYLEKCLDSDSAIELWLFSESFGVSDLAEPCKRYVQSYFRSISRSQRILELDRQEIAALLGLEEVNLGNAANEDTLVELLLRWLTFNPKALDSDLLPVLNKICWNEVSQECKDTFREKLAEIAEDSSSDSFQVLDIISKPSSLNPSLRRTFFSSVCSIGGLQNSRAGRRSPHTSSIEVADIDARTGSILRQWSQSRGFHGRQSTSNINPQYHFLPFHGHLYAFYSFNQDRTLLTSSMSSHQGNKSDDVLCLSVANVMNANLKVLRTRPCDVESVWWDLIDKHNYALAIDEAKGVVFLCGCTEQREGASSKRVFKLDIEKNVCSEMTSLPFGRSHHRAVLVDGELFVLGGVDRLLTPLSTVLKYDWMNNSWEEVSPMHEPRIDGAYACVGGRIYASGGSTSKVRSRNVEVYNPSLDIWTTLSPMSVPRVNHGLVAVGSFLFAMGGQSYSGENGGARNVQRTVERYSIAEGCWEAAWEMSECRWGMTAFTL
ncbi:kelch-like protein 20 [Lytechinus variegatus]|uniref:kelch-like protein 20 n=1 Tax=Lytechinus variegatus TaxID=7654 RepID=UPI001BB22C3E|nr:kelch-like protein 20 [Lytechinus variegatus]XP_041473776.1 kelch-like protein 20 [Lytechinus variegatus]